MRTGPPGATRKLVLADIADLRAYRSREQHAAHLTRHDVTSAVHALRFELTDDEVAALAAGSVRLAIDHPAYDEETELADAIVHELLGDLRPEPAIGADRPPRTGLPSCRHRIPKSPLVKASLDTYDAPRTRVGADEVNGGRSR